MRVGILGSSGLVGRQMIRCIEERQIPITELRLFAYREVGVQIQFQNKWITTQLATKTSLEGLDVLLIATDANISRNYVPIAKELGIRVIDNSSAFRNEADVPLVIPQINANDIHADHMVIANPNCSTILATMSIAKIHEKVGIRHMVVSTYQAVSGAGKQGVEALEQQMRVYPAKYGDNTPFAAPIVNNVIPMIGDFDGWGNTSEENKMMREMNKILHSNIDISCTCVRVPVLRSHSIAMTFWTKQPCKIEEVKTWIASLDGVCYLEDELATPYVASDQDDVLVCRLRQAPFDPCEYTLWCCFDQLRKGAATNAVEILRLIME